MASIINATTSSGVVINSDNTGQLQLQSAGTTSATFNTFGIGLGSATPSSGIGITFPAAKSPSSNANTLDDYEEGTFTPFIRGGTTVGTASYAFQIGIYTKIGNRVFFTISINWSSGTGSGALGIGGLPFTQNGDGYDLPYAISECANIAWDANYFPTPIGLHNTTIILLNASRVGASATSINTNYDAAGYVTMSGHYKI